MAVHAGRALFEQGIGDRRGNAQRGVLVWVYEAGTSTLATLYTDRTKATEQDNPLSTNGLGNLAIYAEPGDYEAHVDSTGAVLLFTVLPDWEDVVTGDEPEGGLPAHLADAVDAHDASAVSFSPAAGVAATDVQAAIVEVAGDVSSGGTALADHLADTVDSHDASAVSFVPTGTIAATNVQTAVAEVATDATSALTAGLATKEPTIPPGTYPENPTPGTPRTALVTTTDQTATGTKSLERARSKYEPYVDGSHSDWGLATDGSDNSARLAAWTAGGAHLLLSKPGTYAFATNATLAVGKTLKLQRGVVLQPASGVTLTIECGLEAGPWPIFDESLGGTVTMTAGRGPNIVYPEWWGATADAFTTPTKTAAAPINVVAFNRALNQGSTITQQREVRMRNGKTYAINGPLVGTSQSVHFNFNGGQLELRNWADTTASALTLGTTGTKVFNWLLTKPQIIKINGTDTFALIRLTHANFTEIRSPRLGGAATTTYGIYLGDEDTVETFIYDAEPTACQYGIFSDGTLAAVDGSPSNVLYIHIKKLQQNSLWGIWLRQMGAVTIAFGDLSLNGTTDNSADPLKNGAIYCEAVSGLAIGKVYFERNGSDAANNQDRIIWLKDCQDVQSQARLSAVNTNHDPEYALYLDEGCTGVTIDGMLRGGRKATVYRHPSLDRSVVVAAGLVPLDANDNSNFRALATDGGNVGMTDLVGAHRPRRFLQTAKELLNYLPAPARLTSAAWTASGVTSSTRNAGSVLAPDGASMADSFVFPTNALNESWQSVTPTIIGSGAGEVLVLRFWAKVLSYTPGSGGLDRRCRVQLLRSSGQNLMLLNCRPGSDWMLVEQRIDTLESNNLGVTSTLSAPGADISYKLSVSNSPTAAPAEIALWGFHLAPEGTEHFADPNATASAYPGLPVHGTGVTGPLAVAFNGSVARLVPLPADPTVTPPAVPYGDTLWRVGDIGFVPSAASGVNSLFRVVTAGNQAGAVWAAVGPTIPTVPSITTGRIAVDQAVTDATQTALTGLSSAIAANEVQQIDVVVFYDSTTANDMRLSITVPAGATVDYGQHGLLSTVTTNSGSMSAAVASSSGALMTFGGSRAAGAAAVKVMAVLRCLVANGATAGTVQVRGAKTANTDATSPADDCTFYRGSHLRSVRM